MTKKLYKSRRDAKLTGVCAGLADYFNIDSGIMRVATAVGTVLTGGALAIAYIVCAVVIPVEPAE